MPSNESDISMSVSASRLKTRDDTEDSHTTTAYPMPMHEMRNSSGTRAEFHSGWSLCPARSITVPRDDWCIVGSRMPSAMTQSSDFSMIGLIVRARLPSALRLFSALRI